MNLTIKPKLPLDQLTTTLRNEKESKKTEGLELGAVDKLLVGIFVGCDGREGKTCVHTLSRPSYLFYHC